MDIRRTTLVGATLVLTALLAACAAQSAALLDTEWVLISLNGNALIEGKEITLSFGEASIEGSGGCNTYGGSYTASEDSLRLSGVYATEMACMELEGIMEQEKAYFEALNAAARYRVAQDQGGGDRLELYDEAGAQVLVFVVADSPSLAQVTPTPEPSGQSAALLDTEWVLVSLNGNTLIEDKQIMLRFGEGSLEGFGGCNTYGGSYAASEDSLRLDGVYATEMACMEPAGILDQEQAYFQALNAVVSYRVDGDRLELYDEAGAQILAFVASTSEEEMPTRTTPMLSLDCTLEMDETYPVGEPVNLRFALHNHTDHPLYVLIWYTPLEGIAGETFQVTRNGEKLLYQGMLAKRGDPVRDEYVVIEPGDTASAQVDLRAGYGLSTPGSYQVQFTAGLQDVTDDGSLVPQKRDDHRPQSLSCNTVGFSIVPAPEPPTVTPVAAATPTEGPPTATLTPEPPAGFRRYVHGPSGVSVWVPESWTVIEPGPHGGSTILQSYPQDKYVGGEARQPGDTKCDLTVHPPGTSVADVVARTKSNPDLTVVSEGEIVLHSGQSGIRREIESLGRSLSLYTEINEQVVVLTCFGELAPFDEIAVTLGAAE